jgi:hypothetical protein
MIGLSLSSFSKHNMRSYYHWVDTSAGGLLVPESTIHPVVNVSITWFDSSAGGLLVDDTVGD